MDGDLDIRIFTQNVSESLQHVSHDFSPVSCTKYFGTVKNRMFKINSTPGLPLVTLCELGRGSAIQEISFFKLKCDLMHSN